jgi:phosphoglycolate phosphatase/pyrophosphatase PpaX
MLKYRCLVLDHDDTVVRSCETVNYPAFLEALAVLRPKQTLTLQEFNHSCFEQGFSALCREKFQFSAEEIQIQFGIWKDYVRTHTPQPFDGIAAVIERFRAEGGIVCVSSHSVAENILRDYSAHFHCAPDQIFGWDLGDDRRKPAPFALEEIMRIYALAPTELLMVDDLKPGYTMARAAGVPFACAGWSHEDADIARYMRENSDVYLETVEDFARFLFGD